MIDQFGLEAYARVMTRFASAERNINRAWSASADGYRDEVVRCLHDAANLLEAARAELTEAREKREAAE